MAQTWHENHVISQPSSDEIFGYSLRHIPSRFDDASYISERNVDLFPKPTRSNLKRTKLQPDSGREILYSYNAYIYALARVNTKRCNVDRFFSNYWINCYTILNKNNYFTIERFAFVMYLIVLNYVDFEKVITERQIIFNLFL